MIHVRNICPHISIKFNDTLGVNIPYMEHMGIVWSCFDNNFPPLVFPRALRPSPRSVAKSHCHADHLRFWLTRPRKTHRQKTHGFWCISYLSLLMFDENLQLSIGQTSGKTDIFFEKSPDWWVCLPRKEGLYIVVLVYRSIVVVGMRVDSFSNLLLCCVLLFRKSEMSHALIQTVLDVWVPCPCYYSSKKHILLLMVLVVDPAICTAFHIGDAGFSRRPQLILWVWESQRFQLTLGK